MRNKFRDAFAEEGASIRAVQGTFADAAGIDPATAPSPKEIYEIGTGAAEGNRDAALKAYEALGEVVGDALANALTLIDGLAVIGGGLAGAAPLFMPRLIAEMNGTISKYTGEQIPRMAQKAFDLTDDQQTRQFLRGGDQGDHRPEVRQADPVRPADAYRGGYLGTGHQPGDLAGGIRLRAGAARRGLAVAGKLRERIEHRLHGPFAADWFAACARLAGKQRRLLSRGGLALIDFCEQRRAHRWIGSIGRHVPRQEPALHRLGQTSCTLVAHKEQFMARPKLHVESDQHLPRCDRHAFH